MPCDALTYSFVVQELNAVLSGGRIDKIMMPERDEILLGIRANGVNRLLLISAGTYARTHLTLQTKQAPLTAYSFCMHLRKNIGGGIIESVSSQPDERIIFINILFKNELGVREDKRLACEIMGKYSNIILIGADGRITECLKHIQLDSAAKRPVLPGLAYTLPVQDRLSPLDREGIMRLNLGSDAYSALAQNVRGLAPVSLAEAVFNAGATSNPDGMGDANDMNNENTAYCTGKDDTAYKIKLADAFTALYTQPVRPCIGEGTAGANKKDTSDGTCLTPSKETHVKEAPVSDFFIRPYNCLDCSYRFFDTLNGAMDFFYSEKDRRLRLESKSRNLLSIARAALKRAEKRLGEFYIKQQSCDDLETDRIAGELITANIYRLTAGATTLVTPDYYSGREGEITIALDPSLTPAQNAQKHFKRYQKKKRTLLFTREQAQRAQSEIETISAILDDLSNVCEQSELLDIADEMAEAGLIKPQKRDKNQKPAVPHRFTVQGFTVLAGKNNVQNERLTKSAGKNDIWLHVKDFSGSHVIIETQGKSVPHDEVIVRAAQLAAYYSKARESGKADVDYTLVKHVSKPSGAAPGKVVYTHHKTVSVEPKN